MSDQLSNLILATTRLTWIESHDLAARIRDQFLVIPRTDLPLVTVHGHGRITADGLGGEVSGVETASRNALAWLALAEYLDAHPPIDQAQVNALAAALKDHPMFGLGRPDADLIARDLIATGRVTITPVGGAS